MCRDTHTPTPPPTPRQRTGTVVQAAWRCLPSPWSVVTTQRCLFAQLCVREIWEVCVVSSRSRGGMWDNPAPCRSSVTVPPCPDSRVTCSSETQHRLQKAWCCTANESKSASQEGDGRGECEIKRQSHGERDASSQALKIRAASSEQLSASPVGLCHLPTPRRHRVGRRPRPTPSQGLSMGETGLVQCPGTPAQGDGL